MQVSVYADRSIPAGIRRSVIARDGMVCRLCSRAVVRRGTREPYQPDSLHVDHVIQWAEGGPSTVENLRVVCSDCNLRRPRPTNVVRQNLVHVEQRDGAYYWPAGYTPPRVRRSGLYSVGYVAALLGASDAQVLAFVHTGQLAASAEGPIKVAPPRAQRQKPKRATAFGVTEPAWLARERSRR